MASSRESCPQYRTRRSPASTQPDLGASSMQNCPCWQAVRCMLTHCRLRRQSTRRCTQDCREIVRAATSS
eukprot:6182951-Pleurochrysis_carterae.AAC.4